MFTCYALWCYIFYLCFFFVFFFVYFFFFFSSRRRHTRFDCDEFRRVLFRSLRSTQSDGRSKRAKGVTRIRNFLLRFSGKRARSCALVVQIAHGWGVVEGARVFARLSAWGLALRSCRTAKPRLD